MRANCKRSTNPRPKPRGVMNDWSSSWWRSAVSRTPNVGREGIAAESQKDYGGNARRLVESLRELAEKRKQWDVVAAHAAYPFFESPSPSGFQELIKAARIAKVEEPVRASALRFLETGIKPYRVIAKPAAPKYPARTTQPARKKAISTRRSSTTLGTTPEPLTPAAPLQIDRAWPLPIPDYLIPLLDRRGGFFSEPAPTWISCCSWRLPTNARMRCSAGTTGSLRNRRFSASSAAPLGYADRVAAAVADAYPERAIAI